MQPMSSAWATKGSVFPYPGSKSKLAPWIIDHFPDHECYVEAFGGSAAVLTTKEPSPSEVFNDIDDDITHFFHVLRERCDELVEWLRNNEFSRKLHKQYATEFYQGLRPADDIERAGRFFYLRHTQFAQNYEEVSGYRGARTSNHAAQYDRAIDALYNFRDRLRQVQIEHLDYDDLVDRYDAADTLWYFDPPYYNPGRTHYTGHAGFEHERFTTALKSIDGYFVTSYSELPPSMSDEFYVVEKDVRGTMRNGQAEWSQESTERLVLNFHPKRTTMFVADSNQNGLDAYTDGGR